jgi:hypothetical protein
VHDLAVSKLVAGREKDLNYVRQLIHHRMVQETTLRARLKQTPLASDQTELISARLERLLKNPSTLDA